MPKMVANQLMLQRIKRVFNVVQVAAVQSMPVYEVDAAFTTYTDFIPLLHLGSCFEAMQIFFAIGIGAFDL